MMCKKMTGRSRFHHYKTGPTRARRSNTAIGVLVPLARHGPPDFSGHRPVGVRRFRQFFDLVYLGPLLSLDQMVMRDAYEWHESHDGHEA
jgi:hypothetical protein